MTEAWTLGQVALRGLDGGRGRSYPAEFKAETVELYRSSEVDPGHCGRVRVSRESLRRWIAGQEIDAGKRQGLTTEEREELRQLRREEPPPEDGARHLMKSSSLLRERVRDPVAVPFITAEKANFWVRMMCRVLGLSRSSFLRVGDARAFCQSRVRLWNPAADQRRPQSHRARRSGRLRSTGR